MLEGDVETAQACFQELDALMAQMTQAAAKLGDPLQVHLLAVMSCIHTWQACHYSPSQACNQTRHASDTVRSTPLHPEGDTGNNRGVPNGG